MDTETYFKNILKKEELKADSDEVKAMQAEKLNVQEVINKAFDGKPTIRYAGSYKKNTMVKSNYDLDIVCYFKHDDESAGKNLEEIFNNVQSALSDKYFVFQKKSALRLQGKEDRLDFHIDVVPGRFVDDSETDCFLHQTSGDKNWLKTNLDKHIEHIGGSGLTDTIKLVKIWRNTSRINVKTFVLELLVVKILGSYKDKDGLEKCLKTFFEKMAAGLKDVAVEDPANSGNDLSSLFDESVKNTLSWSAKIISEFVKKGEWQKIYGEIEDKSASKVSSGFIPGATVSVNKSPASPWSSIGQ